MKTPPCGCRIDIENGVFHLYPCRDNCPLIDEIAEWAKDRFPNTPRVDAREVEKVLGRALTGEECLDALKRDAERN